MSLSNIIKMRFCKQYSENQAVQNFSKELCRELIGYTEESMKKFGIHKDTRALPKLEEDKESEEIDLVDAYSSLENLLQYCQKEVNLNKNRETVTRVLNYMDQNMDNVTLDNAAMYVKTTPIYLSIIFREIYGINFKECLIQKKIAKAKELLSDSQLRIYEISSKVGYSDVKYFSKIFKRYMGLNPQEYRKQYMKNMEEVDK